MAIERFANLATTTLNGAINAAVTSIAVISATGFSSTVQYRINIDDELMLVTAGAGTTTWTVTRGIEGTTAASHANGASVTQVLTAGGLAQVSPAVSSGPYASLPATPVVGQRYYCTDSPYILEWNGTSWLVAYDGLLVTRPDQYTWTWQNQQTSTVDLTKGYSRMVSNTSTGGAQIQHAAPTLSATPTLEVFQWMAVQTSGGFPLIGAVLINSSNQMYGYSLAVGSAGDLRVSVGYGVAYALGTLVYDVFGGTNVGPSGSVAYLNSHLHCMRVAYNGVDCQVYYSEDGGGTYALLSATAVGTALPGGAPNRIGLYLQGDGRVTVLTTYHVRVF